MSSAAQISSQDFAKKVIAPFGGKSYANAKYNIDTINSKAWGELVGHVEQFAHDLHAEGGAKAIGNDVAASLTQEFDGQIKALSRSLRSSSGAMAKTGDVVADAIERFSDNARVAEVPTNMVTSTYKAQTKIESGLQNILDKTLPNTGKASEYELSIKQTIKHIKDHFSMSNKSGFLKKIPEILSGRVASNLKNNEALRYLITITDPSKKSGLIIPRQIFIEDEAALGSSLQSLAKRAGIAIGEKDIFHVVKMNFAMEDGVMGIGGKALHEHPISFEQVTKAGKVENLISSVEAGTLGAIRPNMTKYLSKMEKGVTAAEIAFGGLMLHQAYNQFKNIRQADPMTGQKHIVWSNATWGAVSAVLGASFVANGAMRVRTGGMAI